MMGYFAFFQRSQIMRLHLHHRLWTWNTAIRLPVLAMLPFGLYFCFWWVLVPGLAAIPFGVTAGLVEPLFFVPAVVIGSLVSFIAMIPMFVGLMIEVFPGYFACVALMFGRSRRAEEMRDAAIRDLTNWTRNSA